MLVKIVLILASLGALIAMLRRQFGRKPDRRSPDTPRANTLSSTKCQACGIYLPEGQSCGCADHT